MGVRIIHSQPYAYWQFVAWHGKGLLWTEVFSQGSHGISILRIVSYGTHLDHRIGPLKFLRVGSARSWFQRNLCMRPDLWKRSIELQSNRFANRSKEALTHQPREMCKEAGHDPTMLHFEISKIEQNKWISCKRNLQMDEILKWYLQFFVDGTLYAWLAFAIFRCWNQSEIL